MPVTPPRECAEPNCKRLTHYRFCREHRMSAARVSRRNRICQTFSELAEICVHLSSKGVEAQAVLSESGVVLSFDNKVQPVRSEEIGYAQLAAIQGPEETTELVQSILRSFARRAQQNGSSAAAA